MHQPYYQALIAKHTQQDPHTIEGLIRLQHGTLDSLSPAQFQHEIRLAEGLIAEVGFSTAQRYAGLAIGNRPA